MNYIRVNQILLFFLCMIAVTNVFAVTVFPRYIHYIFLIPLPLFFIFLHSFSKDIVDFFIIISILLFFPLIVVFVSYIFPDDRFLDMYQIIFWDGRFINSILMLIFYLFSIYLFTRRKIDDFYFFLRCFIIGILFLIISGYWQAISYYVGIIPFPFETRSHMHSSGGVSISTALRVTGIASEPSYLVPFLIDAIGIGLIIYRFSYKYFILLFLSLGLLFLSFSPTGIIIFVVAILLTLISWLFKYTLRLKIIYWILALVIILFLLAFFMYLVNTEFFMYIHERIVNFDSRHSSRAFMNFSIVSWFNDGDIWRWFLGYGMKGFALLGSFYTLPTGEPIHITSNNLFIDTLWEGGILILLLLIFIFVFIYKKIFTLVNNKILFFGLIFYYFSIVISSFARADFVTPRFFIFLIVMSVFIIRLKSKS